jgi:hypothetical protein
MTNNIVNVCPTCGQEWSTEKVFTPDEIRKMKPEEYVENRERILRQLEKGKILKNQKGD